jgi:hypothetical protein
MISQIDMLTQRTWRRERSANALNVTISRAEGAGHPPRQAQLPRTRTNTDGDKRESSEAIKDLFCANQKDINTPEDI